MEEVAWTPIAAPDEFREIGSRHALVKTKGIVANGHHTFYGPTTHFQEPRSNCSAYVRHNPLLLTHLLPYLAKGGNCDRAFYRLSSGLSRRLPLPIMTAHPLLLFDLYSNEIMVFQPRHVTPMGNRISLDHFPKTISFASLD